MIRGLIIVKAEHVAEARAMAVQPPFSSEAGVVAQFLAPANPQYDADMNEVQPSTHYWASGEFEPEMWGNIVTAAAALDWGGAWEYDLATQPEFPQEKLAEILSQPLFAARKR